MGDVYEKTVVRELLIKNALHRYIATTKRNELSRPRNRRLLPSGPGQCIIPTAPNG